MARRRYTMQGGKPPPPTDPDRRPPHPDPEEPFPPDDDDAPEDAPANDDDPPTRQSTKPAARAKEELVPAKIARLKAEIAEHGREWKRISRGSGSPPPRAHQFAELMDVKQQMVESLEGWQEVQVDRPARGTAYIVGEREFRPGRHRVKDSVAEVLRWLMDQNRIAEARRMTNLAEQRAMDPFGLEGIIDPATQTDKAIGTVQA